KNLSLQQKIEDQRTTNALLFAIGEKAKESAAQAIEAAEKAKLERALAEKSVEEFRQTNLVLQAKVLQLEIRTKDRSIDQKATDAMVLALPNIPSGKVVVADFQSDREAVNFGKHISYVLKGSGCD